MPSAFDSLRNTVFDNTRAGFGRQAVWMAADGGASFSGLVHFNNPTESLKTLGFEFQVDAIEIEYREGEFEGLKERTDKRNSSEVITIDGTEYLVRQVLQIHDGGTFLAKLVPKPS